MYNNIKLILSPPFDKSTGVIKIKGLYYNQREHRFQVKLMYKDGKTVTKAFARYKMEKHLGYELPKNMHVHHKNEDTIDDRIENLEVINIAQHNSLHKKQYFGTETLCLVCGRCFFLMPRMEKEFTYSNGTRYIYCSKSCVSKSRNIRNHSQISVNREKRLQLYGF